MNTLMKPGRIGLLFAAALLICTSFGCSSEYSDVSYNAIRRNITPELRGSFERPIDQEFHMSMNFEHDMRLFWDDLGRTYYTDHPSRLSPFPVMYTSGMPR